MSIDYKYNSESNIFFRIWDHAAMGLAKDIGDRQTTPCNIVEKAGDGILWTLGTAPRAIKAVVKSFQDPRVVTIALTALALIATSLIFYPATTVAAASCTFTAIATAIKWVPLWAVKFSAYLATCATIVGAGLRAGGRFNNKALMKEFYNLQEYPGNPSRLYAFEIADLQRTSV